MSIPSAFTPRSFTENERHLLALHVLTFPIAENAPGDEGLKLQRTLESIGKDECIEPPLISVIQSTSSGVYGLSEEGLRKADEMKHHTVGNFLKLRETEINEPDRDGASALHYAVRGSSQLQDVDKTVQLLVTSRALLDARTKTGDTPLHWAGNATLGTVSYLVEQRADPLALNEAGKTPLELCKPTNSDVIKYLQSFKNKEGNRVAEGVAKKHDPADGFLTSEFFNTPD